jgi:hypothetical protein
LADFEVTIIGRFWGDRRGSWKQPLAVSCKKDRQCSFRTLPSKAPVHFEALLRLSTMAGSPNHFQVIALHRVS